jgi:hypothetical protein
MPDNSRETSRQSKEEKGQYMLAVDTKRALSGGLLAAVVALLGSVIVGRISSAEARILLQAMLPSIRFLSSGIMTASATILALMLTLLSLSHNTSSTLRPVHYQRVRQIAFIDAITLSASVILLLLISIPLEESSEVPSSWYVAIYYALLVASAALGGLLISVVFMLYNAIGDLIQVMGPTGSSDLVQAEEKSRQG